MSKILHYINNGFSRKVPNDILKIDTGMGRVDIRKMIQDAKNKKFQCSHNNEYCLIIHGRHVYIEEYMESEDRGAVERIVSKGDEFNVVLIIKEVDKHQLVDNVVYLSHCDVFG